MYGEKLDIPLPKHNQKAVLRRQMTIYSKSIRILLNILWISLEDASYEQLQAHEKLLVQLGLYLSSDMSAKNREKESLTVATM
jgi:hypothetical protein